MAGLVRRGIGGNNDTEARARCCRQLSRVADADAAGCLCAAITGRGLGVDVYTPVAVNLLTTCGKLTPRGFRCLPAPATDGKVDHTQLRA